MKTIIAGSRDINDFFLVDKAIKESNFLITEVVSGTARGVDNDGEHWGHVNKIPVKRFPAEWTIHGKSDGYKRNVDMAEYADAAIIIWDGKSKGSKHMIDIAKEKKLKVFIKIVD